MCAPVEPQPAHILLDRVDELLLFLGRVGVVEPQMATAAIFLSHAEVQAYGFRVTDMQIAVGLRREAGDDLCHAPRLDIGLDDVSNEVAAGIRRGCRFGYRHFPAPDRTIA